MEIEKGYKKGLISLGSSISIGLLISFIFYLLYSTNYSYEVKEPGLILLTTMVFLGVSIIVSLFYIALYTRKNQKEALNVAVINVFVLWLIALIMKLYV
jgi:hypothetical protein